MAPEEKTAACIAHCLGFAVANSLMHKLPTPCLSAAALPCFTGEEEEFVLLLHSCLVPWAVQSSQGSSGAGEAHMHAFMCQRLGGHGGQIGVEQSINRGQ